MKRLRVRVIDRETGKELPAVVTPPRCPRCQRAPCVSPTTCYAQVETARVFFDEHFAKARGMESRQVQREVAHALVRGVTRRGWRGALSELATLMLKKGLLR